jgi:hypothetical protein
MQIYVVAGCLLMIGLAIALHTPHQNQHLHLALIAIAICIALAEAQPNTAAATTTRSSASESVASTQSFTHSFDPTSGKYEAECRRILEDIFHLPFPKVRPAWLKNKKTNRCLEIDCYCSQLRLGLEFNGRQHSEYTPRFHKSEADFLYQKEKDEMKASLCKHQGVTLITVPHSVPFDRLREYIVKQISKTNIVIANSTPCHG